MSNAEAGGAQVKSYRPDEAAARFIVEMNQDTSGCFLIPFSSSGSGSEAIGNSDWDMGIPRSGTWQIQCQEGGR